MPGEMLFKCPVCAPATDHGSATMAARRGKRWRTIDIVVASVIAVAFGFLSLDAE